MPKWKPKCFQNRWKLSFGEVSKTACKKRRQNDAKMVSKRSPGRPPEGSKWRPNSIPNRVLEQVSSMFGWFSVIFAVCFPHDISYCWHGCCIGHIRSFWWCWVVEFSSVGGWMACTIGCSGAEVGSFRSLLDVAYWIACWIACLIACWIARLFAELLDWLCAGLRAWFRAGLLSSLEQVQLSSLLLMLYL